MASKSARPGLQSKQQRANKTLAALKRHYPQATTALKWKHPLELLIATILSAQCTDKQVNKVTPLLFKKYPRAQDYATASQKQLEQEIRSTGFFRRKAQAIRAGCKILVEDHSGKVPASMEQLIKLPGVARKTANVVLGAWTGTNQGIAVDTHVGRVTVRLGLTSTARDSKDAKNIEKDLMKLIARKDWAFFSNALIFHGRSICTARNPKCAQCCLADWCPSAFKV